MAIDTAQLEANKRLVRRFHHRVWTVGDVDAVDGLMTDDHVEHNPSAPELHGRGAYADHVSTVRSAFAGYEVVPRDVIAEGDIVVVRHARRGTHVGEFAGVAPTGNPFEVPGVVLHRMADGRIAESWVNVDTLGLLEQLGLVHPPWNRE